MSPGTRPDLRALGRGGRHSQGRHREPSRWWAEPTRWAFLALLVGGLLVGWTVARLEQRGTDLAVAVVDRCAQGQVGDPRLCESAAAVRADPVLPPPTVTRVVEVPGPTVFATVVVPGPTRVTTSPLQVPGPTVTLPPTTVRETVPPVTRTRTLPPVTLTQPPETTVVIETTTLPPTTQTVTVTSPPPTQTTPPPSTDPTVTLPPTTITLPPEGEGP